MSSCPFVPDGLPRDFSTYGTKPWVSHYESCRPSVHCVVLGSYQKAFRDGCFPSRPKFRQSVEPFPSNFRSSPFYHPAVNLVNTTMKFPNVKFLFHTFVFLLNTYEIAAFRRLQTKGIRPALGTNVKFLPSCFFETQMYRMENGTLRMGILKTKGHGLSWAR
jgi:hypothetical protein